MILYPKKQVGSLARNGYNDAPIVENRTLLDGLGGNLQTVKIIKQVARQKSGDPQIRQLALDILNQNGTKSHAHLDEAYCIGTFVQNNMAYVRDATDIEQLSDPSMLVEHMKKGIARGDCDDMSCMIATLLLSIGHHPFLRCVRYGNKTGNYNHIYVVVYETNEPYKKEERLVLDAIIKDKQIGAEVPHTNGDEFEV